MRRSSVAIVGCSSYADAQVEAAVQRGVDLLGGIGRFVSAGERIVLKPNVLYGSRPERCVVTHPAVFRAVAQVCLRSGARVSYGDGSAVRKSRHNLRTAGIAAEAERLGLPVADFDNGRTVSHLDGRFCRQLYLANGVLDADGLVSVCKLKTHGLTRMTGAVKNQLGCVPGVTKGQYHARFPDPWDFSRLLVDINTYVKPRLFVMDAVMAMEGNGPGSGDPRELGLLLFSADPVALDAIACRIIDLDVRHVPTVAAGQEAGLGTADPVAIDLVGDPIGDFLCPTFRVTRKPPVEVSIGGVRSSVRNALLPKPVISPARCIRCGECVAMCPVNPKAVNWATDVHSRPPTHTYRRCIRCMCCHEVCPAKAIRIKTPFLGAALPALSYAAHIVSRAVTKLRHGRDS